MSNNYVSDAIISSSLYLGKDNILSQSRIMSLLNVIKHAADNNKHVIAFTSAYVDEGAIEIAYQSAVSMASMAGKKVLLLDANMHDGGLLCEFRKHIKISLVSAVQINNINNCSVLEIENTNLYYATFYKNNNEQDLLIDTDRFHGGIKYLKQNFDWIFIISENAVVNDLFLNPAIVDTSILVVEAERTRKQVIIQLINNLKSNGLNVIGTVLNKRPLYIPQKLYTFLYR